MNAFVELLCSCIVTNDVRVRVCVAQRAKAIAEGDEATLATLGDADDAEADLGKKLSDDNVGSKLLKLMVC